MQPNIRRAVPVNGCDHTRPDQVYDANGYGRWCGQCGDSLVEVDGWGIWPLVLFVLSPILVLMLYVSVVAMLPTPADRPGPRVTPSSYPNPPVVRLVP